MADVEEGEWAAMGNTERNSNLSDALAVYAGVEEDYLQALRDAGIDLGKRNANVRQNADLRESLAKKGACFCNGGASISHGFLSQACVACTGGEGSRTFYFSLRCHRNCYFCFNPNQEDYAHYLDANYDWRADFAELAASERQMTHIALTGGEPLLNVGETLSFFHEAHRLWPNAHLRLYTAGDMLGHETMASLVAEGLSEIRFSVKLEDSEDDLEETYAHIGIAREFDVDVMVEMPVIPGTLPAMKRLLSRLDAMGVRGINLLEFCYPHHNWQAFASRGFKVKNPPFSVYYNYCYAGGLPIEGSEEEALELLEFAIDEGMAMGVHYCSLENKHRDQILSQNRLGVLGDSCYALDGDDFYYKTLKIYDEDACRARSLLESCGETDWRFDGEECCVLANPSMKGALLGAGIAPVVSYNVLELRNEGLVLRELALKPLCPDGY